jgi:hypothetical protein
MLLARGFVRLAAAFESGVALRLPPHSTSCAVVGGLGKGATRLRVGWFRRSVGTWDLRIRGPKVDGRIAQMRMREKTPTPNLSHAQKAAHGRGEIFFGLLPRVGPL